MNRQSISGSVTFMLALVLISSSGCGKGSSSDSKATQTAPSSSLPPSRPATVAPKVEEFHSLDPTKSGFSIGFKASGRVEWDSDGMISGDIDSLFCIDPGGRQVPIELASKSVSAGNAQTVRFGTIKLQSAGGFSTTCLIKDSQIEQIQAFLKSTATIPTAQAEVYQGTKLPFEAKGVGIAKGAKFSTDDEACIKDCTGMFIKSIYLGKLDIPLQSTNVTDKMMIETKDYGKLKIKINFATRAYSILITPTQEEQFQKLFAGQQ